MYTERVEYMDEFIKKNLLFTMFAPVYAVSGSLWILAVLYLDKRNATRAMNKRLKNRHILKMIKEASLQSKKFMVRPSSRIKESEFREIEVECAVEEAWDIAMQTAQ